MPRVGWGNEPPLKGNKSYAGKNHFGNYRLCAMGDLFHYLRHIPCVETVDVPSL